MSKLENLPIISQPFFAERPAMPQNVEAFVNTTMNPAKIRVSWRPGFDGNSPLINHLVEMRTLSGGPNNDLASEWTTVVENVPPELCCSVLVDNLRPSASAEFRVIAVNRFGQVSFLNGRFWKSTGIVKKRESRRNITLFADIQS